MNWFGIVRVWLERGDRERGRGVMLCFTYGFMHDNWEINQCIYRFMEMKQTLTLEVL